MASFSADFKQVQSLTRQGSKGQASTPIVSTSKVAVRHEFGGSAETDYFIQLGMVRRSRAALRSHGLIVGDIGSGKNLIGDAWIAHALSNRAQDDIFVLFDPKGTTQQLLSGLGVDYEVLSIDDRRGIGLDITGDCDSLKVCFEYAKAIFPDKPGAGDQFWSYFAQSICIGVWNVMKDIHYQAPYLATLIRVLKASANKDKDFLISFLSLSPLNTRLCQVLESSDTVKAGVTGEMLAAIERLTPAAAHDARVKQRISMRDFVNRRAVINGKPVRVLVLNMDMSTRRAAETYIRLAFRMLANSIVSYPDQHKDPNHPKIFIMIDELPFLSSTGLPGLEEVLSVSRSKGCHCLAIIQSVSQLVQSFGEVQARAILNSLPDKIYTATGSPENAKSYQEALGAMYRTETKLIPNLGTSGVSYQVIDREELKVAHPGGELLSLPFPNKENGLHFLQLDSDYKAGAESNSTDKGAITGYWSGQLVAELMPRFDTTVPGYLPHFASYYYLPELRPEEVEHLTSGVSPLYDQIFFTLQKRAKAAAVNQVDDLPLFEALIQTSIEAATNPKTKTGAGLRQEFLNLITHQYLLEVDAFMEQTYSTSKVERSPPL